MWEWCRDAYADYGNATRHGDGLRLDPDASGHRMNRGGSYDREAKFARAATRFRNAPAVHYYNLGVRAARPLRQNP